ncbi:helix-turn-helix transcriptional regulator [Candidatus Nomurabacteria bacterium]|nr:helix-turn-helix transcriptional regulator [Candidatus Nomurabacteria bacterium]
MKNDQNKPFFIGGRIREAREAVDISQLDLAKALGYESATAISLIESGARNLRAEDLAKVAEVLQKDVKFFLGQEEEISTVRVALRADKEISPEDQKAILHLVEMAKRKGR